MRADIHDGREHMLQSQAGYIDARPHRQDRETSCTARPDHTLGHKHRISVLLSQPLCRKCPQYLPNFVHRSEASHVPEANIEGLGMRRSMLLELSSMELHEIAHVHR